MKLLNDRYKFEKVLGQGGMGKVFLCLDVQNNKLVAVKECLFGTHASSKKIRRIKREFYFMKKIQHSNVVKAFDLIEHPDRYFIVMEYITGITLGQLIQEKPNDIDFEKQIEIIKSICEGVVELNQNGIIHRDLKPANIMLTGKNYRPKILDLGIAKSINKELTTITKTGGVIGTPSYMSPEQIQGKTSYNTDVFSLGIIFYQFLTWQPRSPFFTGNSATTAEIIINKNLPSLTTTIEKFEGREWIVLSNILDRALHKKSSLRIKSTSKLLNEINNLDKNIYFVYWRKFISLLQNYKFIIIVFLVVTSLYFSVPRPQKKQTKTKNIQKLNIAKLKVNSPQSYYYRAKTRQSLGEYNLAYQDYTKAIELNPKYKKAIYQRGTLLFSQGKYKLSERDYLKALALKVDDAFIFDSLGELYAYQRQYDKSLNFYIKSIEVNSKHLLAYLNRASLYENYRKYDLAEKDLSTAITLDPKNSNIYNRRGNLYSQQKKYDLAIKDYNSAIDLDLSNIAPHVNLNNLYRQLKQFDIAQKKYSKSIKRNPTDAKNYMIRGLSYFIIGKYKLSEIDYNKAIQLAPNQSAMYIYRGNLHALEQRYKLAEKDYSMAIRLNPKQKDFYSVRIMLYINQKKFLLAIKDYSSMIKIEPAIASTYFNRGNLYQQLKQYKLAQKDYLKAIELNCLYESAYCNLAMIYEKQKKYNLVEKNYQEAIRFIPNNANIYLHRSQFYRRQKKLKLAKKDQQKAIFLNPRLKKHLQEK